MIPRDPTGLAAVGATAGAALIAAPAAANHASTASNAPYVSAGIALILGSAQLAFVRQQARRNDASLLKDLRTGWLETRKSWAIVLASCVDVDDFYAPHLNPEERSKLTDIMERVESGTADDWEETKAALKWLEGEVAACQLFLGQLAELVLSGRVPASAAYSVVGADLVPHNLPLRIMVGAAVPATGRPKHVWQAICPDTSRHGARQQLIALGDLLWSEAVRRGDVSVHHVLSVAEHKRGARTGALARKRVVILARRLGQGRWGAFALSRQLRDAEHPEKLRIYKQLSSPFGMVPREWPALPKAWPPTPWAPAEWDDEQADESKMAFPEDDQS